MHAVQSALAIRRERERRQSLKDRQQQQNNGQKRKSSLAATHSGIPSDFRSSERSNGTFNYITVGISFVILGSLMLIPIMAGGTQMLGLDWYHLLGIGGLLIAVGVLMIVVHILTDDEPNAVGQAMGKYKAKVTRSSSQNPIIEDVDYGIESRRNSATNASVEKNFEAVVKV